MKLKIKDEITLEQLRAHGFRRPKYSVDTGKLEKLEYHAQNWGKTYIDTNTYILHTGCTNTDRVDIYYIDQVILIHELSTHGLLEVIQ